MDENKNEDENNLFKALLIIGPTGVGKTPFGQQLETQALWGKRWHHFDFGQKLREAVAKKGDSFFSNEELSVIENSLNTNSLLESKDFPIAEKILKKFMTEKCFNLSTDVVILNGFPRNIGQAELLTNIIDVRTVMLFAAAPSVILARITSDAGGDRAERTDDSLAEIYKKLDIFREQTMPLLDYYKTLDRNILHLEVDEETIPLYIIQSLNSMKVFL